VRRPSRATEARISSADLVHTKGAGAAFVATMWSRNAAFSASVLANAACATARRRGETQPSTRVVHDALAGVE
jgi:hypothetical protein